MKVHNSEGLATHAVPESCVSVREDRGEALTGARIGQPLSGENFKVRDADALEVAEGNTGRCASASACLVPRRLRPWHVRTPSVRKPGGLRHRPSSLTGRIGKAKGQSR